MSLVMRVLPVVAVITCTGLVWPHPLAAQICDGHPSLRERKVILSARVASYTHATAAEAALTAGRSAFGTFSGGRTRDSEYDAETWDWGLRLGYDLPVSADRRVYFCPVVAASLALGPHWFLTDEGDYRYRTVGAGIGIAGIGPSVKGVSIVPAADIRVMRLALTFLPSADQRRRNVRSWTRRSTYQVVTVRAGLVFRDVVTIRPGITVPFGFPKLESGERFVVPFGREDQERAIEIGAAIALWPRPKPTPNR